VLRADGWRRSPMPSTLLAQRFLEALLRWLARETRDDRPIALPSGPQDPAEIAPVLNALLRARAERAPQ
jgi:hypothetical protein